MLFLKWNTEYTAVYKGVYLLKENKLYENELHQCKGLQFFFKLSLGLLTATTKKDTENINNKSKKSSN